MRKKEGQKSKKKSRKIYSEQEKAKNFGANCMDGEKLSHKRTCQDKEKKKSTTKENDTKVNRKKYTLETDQTQDY